MLDHAVGPISGYNDVIKDQNADSVQQLLELFGRMNILRRWRTSTTGMVVGQQDGVRVLRQRLLDHLARIQRDLVQRAAPEQGRAGHVPGEIEAYEVDLFVVRAAEERGRVPGRRGGISGKAGVTWRTRKPPGWERV